LKKIPTKLGANDGGILLIVGQVRFQRTFTIYFTHEFAKLWNNIGVNKTLLVS
jgi:hypothetical protein